MSITIPFARHSYQTASKPVSSQRCLNLYAELNPDDTKSKIVLYGTPGLRKLLTLPTSPIYGLHTMNGVLYAVTSTKLYSIDSYWVATELGSVTISGNCSMSDNGTQVVFVDGAKGYVWDGTTLTDLSTVGNWYPSDTVTFQDQYSIFNRKGTGQFFISGLGDATSYDALDFATAEGAPDNLVADISDHRQLYLFGERSIEVWQNTGASAFPFQRVSGAFIERGCAASLSVSKLEGTIFWLADDLTVRMLSGYTPQKISTHAIEYAIEQYSTVSDAFAYTYTERGHGFYVLTFPTESKTWVYDVTNGMWHERSYFLLGTNYRHRSNCHTVAYDTEVVGDYQNGKIYALDNEYYSDDGDPIQRIAISSEINSDRNPMFMSELEIEFESGVGLTAGQGSDPQAMLRWSDDGGRTWSNEHWVDIGLKGKYKNRARWRRLGRFLNRAYELTITDPIRVVIIAAYAEIFRGR